MNKFTKIFFLYTMLVFFNCLPGFAQNNSLKADSARINNKTEQDTRDKTSVDTKQPENNKGGNSQQQVKKIKGARPDMSKARGARPAYVQRQSGSGIPKGIGRPGGAGNMKPGKR